MFHIAKKEFLNNLLSARFVIGFLLCLVLIPFSVLINVDEYRDRMSLYRLDRDAAETANREVRVYSYLRPTVVLPPEPLSIFSKGISAQVGTRVRVRLGEKPLLAEGRAATRDNPFLASFFSVDFVDIAAIIFSLLALLFSYDAFTREKEDGTLRLQMANALGRSRFLAGKVTGILMTLLPVLIFCFLLGAVIVLASGDLAFTAREWGRLAVLAGISLLYLTIFVFIGLLVSARTKTTVTGLVFCLFLWVFLVFVVPNLASYIADSFVPIDSRDNLNRVLDDHDKAAAERIAQSAKNVAKADWDMAWNMNGAEDGRREMYGCSASFFERERQRTMIIEPLRIDNADRKLGPQKAYLDSLAGQSRAAERLAMISPAGAFRAIASALCATDRRSHERIMAEVRQYRETFIRYLQGKNIFASYSYFTPVPPPAFRNPDQLVEGRSGGRFKTLREYDAWAERQTDFRARWQALQVVTLPGDSPDGFPFLDTSDMPRFAERPASLSTGLESSVVPIGLLAVAGVFLFYLGFVAFIRFDVR